MPAKRTTTREKPASSAKNGARGVDPSAESKRLRAPATEQAVVVWADPIEGKCNAKMTKRVVRGRGPRCKQDAGLRTDHAGIGPCYLHGGATRNHRAAARTELARREVRRLGLARGEQPRAVAPAQVMLEALWHAHSDMSLYAELVADLDAEGSTPVDTAGDGGQQPVHTGRLYEETFHLTGERTGEAKRHVLVQLYEDAQKRATDIAAACLRAKVAEEQVKLAQERASAFADAMRALALALGHSPADPAVRQAMRASLALVAGAPLDTV